ncbi:hypothetical protein O1L60_01620 [Streptomyces diastatochromogenes]|nr:hypothetical protein [Streptomyces diastatochromogenes]
MSVRRAGDDTALDLEGTYDQRPVLGNWLVVIGGLLVTAAIAFAVLWFGFSPKIVSAAKELQATGAPRPAPQGDGDELPQAPRPVRPAAPRPAGTRPATRRRPRQGTPPTDGGGGPGGDQGGGSGGRATGGGSGGAAPTTPPRTTATGTSRPRPRRPRRSPCRPGSRATRRTSSSSTPRNVSPP